MTIIHVETRVIGFYIKNVGLSVIFYFNQFQNRTCIKNLTVCHDAPLQKLMCTCK